MTRKEERFATDKGELIVGGPLTPAEIEQLTMHEELANFRPPARQHKALILIASLPEGMVFAAICRQVIVGYVTFHYPDEYSRWRRHPRVLELGGIEVARSWRGYGVASALLKLAFSDDYFEDYIVITNEYFRHWDYKGLGITLWDYRDMLTRLFSKVGFMEKYTTDPDIVEHPANVLMARFGRRVSVDDLVLFEEIAVEPWRPGWRA